MKEILIRSFIIRGNSKGNFLTKDFTQKRFYVEMKKIEKRTTSPLASILAAYSLDLCEINQIFYCALGAIRGLIRLQKAVLPLNQNST